MCTVETTCVCVCVCVCEKKVCVRAGGGGRVKLGTLRHSPLHVWILVDQFYT